jgi:FkbM family methyltransferase
MKPQKNSRQERYFSQYGQDRFIDEHIFHGKTKGLFVEIGAGDGLNLSNTAFFERSRGWKGFCIEPRKKAYKKLQKNRSGVCLNECLSVEPGIKKFLEIEGSGEMLSGVYENYSSEHLTRINEDRDGPNKKKLLRKIKCTPINDFLSKYSLFNIDYCSIDIEGGEIDLVKSIDFTKYRIFCLSIENNYKDQPDD